jgi:hypothetical protein
MPKLTNIPKPNVNKKKISTAGVEKTQVARAYSKKVTTQAPKVKYLPNGNVEISHREYFAELSSLSGASYGVAVFPVQAGDSAMFPWLSTVANSYETCKWKSLRIDFDTEQGSEYPGSVMLSMDYNSADTYPQNKQQIMAFRGAVRTAPWSDCSYVALKSELDKRSDLYVSPAGVLLVNGLNSLSTNSEIGDVRLNNLGNLFVATSGNTSVGDVLGELYVDYTIELKTPSLNNEFTFAEIAGSGPGGGPVSPTTTAPFGSSVNYEGNIQAAYTTPGGAGSFTLTPGTYIISTAFAGTGLGNPTLTALNGSVIPAANVTNTGTTALDSIDFLIEVVSATLPAFKFAYSAITSVTEALMWIAPFPFSTSVFLRMSEEERYKSPSFNGRTRNCSNRMASISTKLGRIEPSVISEVHFLSSKSCDGLKEVTSSLPIVPDCLEVRSLGSASLESSKDKDIPREEDYCFKTSCRYALRHPEDGIKPCKGLHHLYL